MKAWQQFFGTTGTAGPGLGGATLQAQKGRDPRPQETIVQVKCKMQCGTKKQRYKRPASSSVTSQTNHGFNAVSFIAVNRDVMKGSWTETQTHRRWWFNHQFPDGLGREAFDSAMRGCSRNLLRTFLLHTSISKESPGNMNVHLVSVSFPSIHLDKQPSTLPPERAHRRRSDSKVRRRELFERQSSVTQRTREEFEEEFKRRTRGAVLRSLASRKEREKNLQKWTSELQKAAQAEDWVLRIPSRTKHYVGQRLRRSRSQPQR